METNKPVISIDISEEEYKQCKEYAKNHSFIDEIDELKRMRCLEENATRYINEQRSEYIKMSKEIRSLALNVTVIALSSVILNIIVILLMIFLKIPAWGYAIGISGCIIGTIITIITIKNYNEQIDDAVEYIDQYDILQILFAYIIIFKKQDIIDHFNQYLVPRDKLGRDEYLKVTHTSDDR